MMLNFPNARNPLTNIEYNVERQRNRKQKQELEIHGNGTYMSNYILAHTKREKWDKDKNKIRLFQTDEKYQPSDLES